MALLLWFHLVFCSSFLGIHKVLASSSHCSSQQKLLLLELKSSLVFDVSASSKLVTWSHNSSVWKGVTCTDGNIVGLDLSNESITRINRSSVLFWLKHLQVLNLAFNDMQWSSPTLPSLANLSSLVYLNLSYGFYGQIPIEISRLTKLSTLDLSTFTDLSRSVPYANFNLKTLIGNLTDLRKLYLGGVSLLSRGNDWCHALSSSVPNLEVLSMPYCLLSGSLEPLANLSYLSVIKLQGNNLSSTFPEFLGKFSHLSTLELAYCSLYGEIPQKIFQVPTLEILDLSSNELRGTLPEFPATSSLQTLALSQTSLSGTLPNSIGNLKELSTINLANCDLSGSIPSSIATLPQLAYLDLSSNNFSGPIPSFEMSRSLTEIMLANNSLTGPITSIYWEDLPNLVLLDLGNNSLEGSIPGSLFSLPLLQTIDLSDNKFSGQLNMSLNVSFNQLESLVLSKNSLQGSFPQFIFQLQGLLILSLSHNNLSGSFHSDVTQNLGLLSFLDLSYNSFSFQLNSLTDFLANQSNLFSLELSCNQIEGEVPKWIWELKGLRYLNLSSNALEFLEELPSNLTQSLAIIDLHNNKLHGKELPLPSQVGYLDLSSNNFNSVIPADIGKYLRHTTFLSLSNNHFRGHIPQSICQALKLELLDLSNNSLVGTIPQCLMMEGLSVLKLRSNNLSGTIPPTFHGGC